MSGRLLTARKSPRTPRAFTLVEMLVVMVIVALLMALLMTALRSVMRQADSLVCKSNLRQIAFDFQIVAQNPIELKRWHPLQAAPNGFGLTSFLDKLYSAGSYFPDTNGADGDEVREYIRGQSVGICPSGPPRIRVHENRMVLDEEARAIPNPQDVSYAFNARLYQIFRKDRATDEWREWFVTLGANMFNWPKAPRTALVFDVDARAANQAGIDPHLIAPPVEPGGAYTPSLQLNLSRGLRWFPSRRHLGKTNIALLDGSVLSEEDLLASSANINWADARYSGEWLNGLYSGQVAMQGSLWSEDSFDSEVVY